MKDKVFRKMCELSTIVSPYPDVFSIRSVADCLRSTQYTTRKQMKELEKEGLVQRACVGGQDDDGNVRCYHGWSLTKAATQTEVYKECRKLAMDEVQRFFFDPKE